MRPRKVCLCKSVSKEEIMKAIAAGANTVEKIAEATRATTGCGTCKNKVSALIDASSTSEN
ncbi:MAG: (2Fe-2S)-binding protein [Leptospirales bacterium]